MTRCIVSGGACLVLAAASATAAAPGQSRPGATAARSRTIVDPAVVTAGAVGCRHCPGGDCPLHHGHLGACRDGLCAPHCPVRPAEYGFYRTQWRRWPGQGVVPANAEQAVTPVSPPPSVAPSMEEESPLPPPDAIVPTEPAAGDAESGGEPTDDEPVRVRTPAAPLPSDPLPEQEDAVAPRVEPGTDAAQGPVEGEPRAPQPAAPRAGDGELFDQSRTSQPDGTVAGTSGGMRYPAEVGRSIAAGEAPWRLRPAGRQRPVDSARGL